RRAGEAPGQLAVEVDFAAQKLLEGRRSFVEPGAAPQRARAPEIAQQPLAVLQRGAGVRLQRRGVQAAGTRRQANPVYPRGFLLGAGVSRRRVAGIIVEVAHAGSALLLRAGRRCTGSTITIAC